MKRAGELFEQLCSFENLRLAFVKARQRKQFCLDVRIFGENLDAALERLRQELLNGTFSFGDYTSFKVYDPKERVIHAAAFPERLVHHAIINVCGKRLESSLIDDSYACREDKGQVAAKNRARHFLRRHPWCLKLDIHHYFDSIDQVILLEMLKRKFKERRLLALLENLLKAYHSETAKGVPIGNLTSQFFANLYLDPFDRFAGEHRDRSYLRYMDDMLVFGEHEDLKALLHDAKTFLWERLQLTIKHGGSLHRSDRGVDFLGYRLFPDRTLLNARSRQRFKQKYKHYTSQLEHGLMSEQQYQAKCGALFAFVRHADTFGLRTLAIRSMDKGSNRALRGGSWNNDASNATCTYRNNNSPGNQNNNNGFRLAVLPSAQCVKGSLNRPLTCSLP